MKKIDIDLTGPTPRAFQMMIGHSLEEVDGFLQKPYYIRVTKENGMNYMVTSDFVTTRVNVTLENGIITEITGLG